MGAAELLIVEDEPDLVDVLTESLTSMGYSIHRAGTVEQAKQSLWASKFHLIICDLSLGNKRKGGLEILEEAASRSTPVILISGHADFEVLKTAINEGVRFFLEKPFDLEVLAKFVREALAGRFELRQRLERLSREKELTPREQEVFDLLSKGLSNKQISEGLGTSERTVKAHLSSIFKKFTVDSRAELLSLLLN
jgi:DNA-binding NarL/FixJ family response regulator